MLAEIERRPRPERDHQRLPARARRRGARAAPASTASTSRSTRCSATASIELTRRDALPQVLRGLEALGQFPEAHPIKVNAVAIRGFTEEEVIPFAEFARRTPYEVRFIEFMPLDADHAWTPDQVLTGAEIRAAIDAVYPLEPEPREPQRDRPRLPVRRRPRQDRLHQPGLRAVLRRLQPDPADRRRAPAHLPVLAQRDRPARAASAPAPTTASSSRSSATPSGARSSSTTSASPASSSRRARCPRSAAKRSREP